MVHQIPIARLKNHFICPVFWVEERYRKYPGKESDLCYFLQRNTERLVIQCLISLC